MNLRGYIYFNFLIYYIMDKKFINLPNKYKIVLEKFIKSLNKDDIKNILNKTIEYNNLNKIHNNFKKNLQENDCCKYDINKMIRSYGKSNIYLSLLKKMTKLRNNQIVLNASNNKKMWNNNLNNIKSKIKYDIKKINNNQIEKSFLKLLLKYKKDWDGLSQIVDVSTNGKIKDINLFDIDDLEFIKVNL